MSTGCGTGFGIGRSRATSWSSRTFTSSIFVTGFWAAHPMKATATGGRNILTHAGDCWDNYQVDFTYPNDVHLSFSSTQFGAYGGFDAGLKMFGALGMATVPYSGPVQIVGSNAWKWEDSRNTAPGSGTFAANGSFLDNLEFADRDKERSFIESIVTGPAITRLLREWRRL